MGRKWEYCFDIECKMYNFMVLVFYSCIISYHKFCILKQLTLFHSLCELGIWPWLNCVLCSWAHQAAVKVLARLYFVNVSWGPFPCSSGCGKLQFLAVRDWGTQPCHLLRRQFTSQQLVSLRPTKYLSCLLRQSFV